LRYAIWSPVVESTRSAASISEVSSTASSSGPRPFLAMASRMASTRAPFFGWKNRLRSQ
jgi:hypothetical protein